MLRDNAVQVSVHSDEASLTMDISNNSCYVIRPGQYPFQNETLLRYTFQTLCTLYAVLVAEPYTQNEQSILRKRRYNTTIH